jgi:DNA-binding CsgD family transcriptional regulator
VPSVIRTVEPPVGSVDVEHGLAADAAPQEGIECSVRFPPRRFELNLAVQTPLGHERAEAGEVAGCARVDSELWRSEAALADLALGDREAAGRLADEELALARGFGVPRALGVAKRAAGVVAGGDRGESLLREAVDDLERGGARLERARALADLGALLRRRNRRTEARALLREALDAAHRSGARPLAEYAGTELRATGARPRRVLLTGLESLTASERRVAEFASEGLTNREIAQTLFITARTVEGHLTSVFRKLRLDSRDQLAAELAASVRVPA